MKVWYRYGGQDGWGVCWIAQRTSSGNVVFAEGENRSAHTFRQIFGPEMGIAF